MEHKILKTLQFSVTFPSTLRFLERFARLAQMNEKQLLLAQYFTDTSLLDCRLVKEKPSRVAAVSLYASLSIFKGEESSIWSSTLTKHTSYRECDVKLMSKDLLQFVKKIEKSQLKTMHKKYNDARFAEVAKLLENVQL